MPKFTEARAVTFQVTVNTATEDDAKQALAPFWRDLGKYHFASVIENIEAWDDLLQQFSMTDDITWGVLAPMERPDDVDQSQSGFDRRVTISRDLFERMKAVVMRAAVPGPDVPDDLTEEDITYLLTQPAQAICAEQGWHEEVGWIRMREGYKEHDGACNDD